MLIAASLIGIGLGALCVLIGLVMIAPEVQAHRVEVTSAGS